MTARWSAPTRPTWIDIAIALSVTAATRHFSEPRTPRCGLGWTLNFGRPLAIVLLAATLIIGVAAPYFLARLVLRLGD